MKHSNFNYTLELNGRDYRSRSDQDENLTPYVSFKETNHFNTLQEAVESLIMIDIRKFELMSDQVNNDTYFEHACITATDNNKPLIEIIRMSFNDTPDGVPSAGIYMNFMKDTVENFEKLSGYDFSEFHDYDPQSSFLLLASYSYDMGFKISIEEALNDWVYSRKHHESSAELSNEEWKYKTGVIQTSLSTPQSNEITNYHYQNLSDAVSQLLQTEITRLDQHLARKSESESWISTAELTKRGKGKLIEFVTVKDNSSREVVSEPGVHLKFYVPIKELEQQSGIDLSRLGNYNQDDQYLLIANYDKYYNKLLPYPGYLSLSMPIDKEHMSHKHAGEEEPYLLNITWGLTQYKNEDDSLFKQQQVKSIPCSSIEQALDGIKELDERFFDEQQAYRQHYPLYVKQADIIDSNNNAVIVSKFQVKEKGEQLPSGIYMKLNEDYVSLELLKLLRSHIKEAQGNSHQLLITDAKSPNLPLPEDIPERKSRAIQRTINPTDSAGLKM